MGLAGGCPECSDGIRYAELGQGDHIHVTLYDHNALESPGVFASLPEPVKLTRLLEDWCFGRVQVFGFVVSQYAPPKSNHAPALILNGKYHPFPKAVVNATFIVFHQHARAH